MFTLRANEGDELARAESEKANAVLVSATPFRVDENTREEGSSWKRNQTAWIIMATGLAIVALAEPLRGSLEETFGPQHTHVIELLVYIVEHLGAVVFVAMIIRLAIEEAANKRALSEVSAAASAAVKAKVGEAFKRVDVTVAKFEDLVEHVNAKLETIQTVTGGNLYGKRLEKGAREEIARVYLNPVFFRPLYKLDLTLTPKGDDTLEVKIRTDTQIENISQTAQPYTVSALLDNALFYSKAARFPRAARFERFEFGPNTPEGRLHASYQPLDVESLTADKLRECLQEKGSDLSFQYDPGELIPPQGLYFIKMEATQQMRESDLFVWNMMIATQEMQVTVHLEGDLTTKNFLVIARPVHHKSNLNLIPTVNESDTALSWTIDGVLLPYQGVNLWWSRTTLGE